MMLRCLIALLPDKLRQRVGDGYGTVVSPGAPYGNHQAGFSLLRVQRQGKAQQILHLKEEVACLLKAEYIIRNRLVQAGLVAQLLNVERVRHKSHVQNQIRL